MSTGYDQAIQNLAWKITEFAIRDFDPVSESLNHDPDMMLKYLDHVPEKKVDWDNLEEISQVVCDTYNVTYEEVIQAVWAEMVKMEMSDDKYWN